MEEEARINLELASLIEEKEVKIQRLNKANATEMAKLDENRRLIAEVTRTAAEIDAMTTGEEDEEHNAKAASKDLPPLRRPACCLVNRSKSFKCNPLKKMTVMLKKKKKKSKRRISSLVKRMPNVLQRKK